MSNFELTAVFLFCISIGIIAFHRPICTIFFFLKAQGTPKTDNPGEGENRKLKIVPDTSCV